jgi:hypothetical protein
LIEANLAPGNAAQRRPTRSTDPRQKDGDPWFLDVDATQGLNAGDYEGAPGSLRHLARKVDRWSATMKKAEQRNTKGIEARKPAAQPALLLGCSESSVTTADTFSSIPQIACRE